MCQNVSKKLAGLAIDFMLKLWAAGNDRLRDPVGDEDFSAVGIKPKIQRYYNITRDYNNF